MGSLYSAYPDSWVEGKPALKVNSLINGEKFIGRNRKTKTPSIDVIV